MVVPGPNKDTEAPHLGQGCEGTRTVQAHGDTTFRTRVWEYWKQEGDKGHRMGMNHHGGHGTVEMCINGTKNGCRRGDVGALGWRQQGLSLGPWGTGDTGDPCSCPVLPIPPTGVKEEPVKEEPVEVKTEPFHGPAADGIPGRGSDCRLPRTGICPPSELCEGWSRSPPRPASSELPLGDLGGQQEPLGSDFPSLLLEQEAEQLSHCGAGEARPPGAAGLDGTPECPQLSLVQSNERLVQEMRAFRREYAESRRETTAVLRGIAQALGTLSRSLAEIRDLYLREREVPKS